MFSPTYLLDRVYTDPSWEEYRISDPDVDPETCISIDLGYERQLTDSLVMRITPFYRKYQNLLQSQAQLVGGVPVGPQEYVSVGEGKAAGCELYVNKRMGNHWEGWFSYTYMKALAHASGPVEFDPNTLVPVDWDQRHTLSAAVALNKGRWTHNLQVQYGSGLPWSTTTCNPPLTRSVSRPETDGQLAASHSLFSGRRRKSPRPCASMSLTFSTSYRHPPRFLRRA
jgi:hypothetical protein